MLPRILLQVICFGFPLAIGTGEESTPSVRKTVAGEKKHHTAIQLISSVRTISPGDKFTVGVLMKMDPGWHTYWKNPGEAGLPTQVKWKLPEGFSAGEIQWPLPHKYNESGEVLTYGYADENMLLVDITSPQTVASGSAITLHAEVEWLECEHICVPGSASVSLKVPVSKTASAQDDVALFDKYRTQMPAAFSGQSELTMMATAANAWIEVRMTPKQGQSFIVVKDDLPDLYPEPIEELVAGRTTTNATASGATLRIPLSAYEKPARSFMFHGTIVYRMQGGERKAVTVEIPLSREFCSSLPVSGETGSSGNILDQTFSTISPAGGGQSLYILIVFAFIGGLLLNVMPCVLPVIALKVFGLVQMAGDHPQQVKKHGVSFSLGILACFLALALLVILLQSAGQQVGWGFQFQEPLFVIAMCVIVFAFGLNLFGVYEIGLPFAQAFVGVGSGLEKNQRAGKGYAASFTEGVFATILATPCTAPFLGAALGFAFSQPAGIILLIFTTVALGMALPYLILTAKPQWMRFLPKPGEWMVNVKQFMGFLMMATLVWLLYVLGKQLGMEAVVWTMGFLLTVGVACWIVGRFATLVATRRRYLTSWGVAIGIIVFGYWIFLESISSVRSVIAGTTSTTQHSFGNPSEGIQWQQFSLDKLNSHLQEGKTVFIDFTAEWCLTCKVNEKTVLTDETVIERFKSSGIVPIRADWTNRNPDITRLLSKFGRSGVPLYVIFPAGRSSQPIVLPEVITSSVVLDAIESAISKQAVALP